MKYVKILGLLAVAAAALMAFAGIAAATTITSDSGETPTIVANSTGATLHNGVGSITCASTVEGKVSSHGAGVTVKGSISKLTFTGCKGGSVHVKNVETGEVATPGSLELHSGTKTGNGTLTSSGATIVVTMLGVECGYTTNGTDIGEVIGGKNATLEIVGVEIPRTHGSAFCGQFGNWTGKYTVSSPTNLSVH